MSSFSHGRSSLNLQEMEESNESSRDFAQLEESFESQMDDYEIQDSDDHDSYTTMVNKPSTFLKRKATITLEKRMSSGLLPNM